MGGNGGNGRVVLRVRGLTAGYGEVNVLDGVDLDAYAGEILGVVGASGAGKTVLLRTILGLIPKRAGTIEMLGVDLATAGLADREAVDKRLGVMFQQGPPFSSLTLLHNLPMPIRH